MMLRLTGPESVATEQALYIDERWRCEANSARPAQTPQEKAALASLTAAKCFAKADKHPCNVAEGLYIGSIGAARNKQGLQKAGIKFVLNASPVVPCFHGGCFRYKTVALYDDVDEDIAQHFPETNTFIDQGRRKGGVLVHCYAGRSRSAALILAYLVAHEGMTVAHAYQQLRNARPSADPNSGFMRQLHAFSQALSSVAPPRTDLPSPL